MSKDAYSPGYYAEIGEVSLRAATELIPVIKEFINPASVIDIGCGTGSWLHIWNKHGVTDICGVDGDYVSPGQLRIKSDDFIKADLENGISLSRTFDLVMCLEVAEHIHAENASAFIASLWQLGDVILFSAAIPGQGGVNHFNEQYPGYWIKLFQESGFSAYDSLREKIWLNTDISVCYRQNILFFVRDTMKSGYPAITQHTKSVLPIVHPELFDEHKFIQMSYKKALRTPFHAGWYFLKKFAGFFHRK